MRAELEVTDVAAVPTDVISLPTTGAVDAVAPTDNVMAVMHA